MSPRGTLGSLGHASSVWHPHRCTAMISMYYSCNPRSKEEKSLGDSQEDLWEEMSPELSPKGHEEPANQRQVLLTVATACAKGQRNGLM